MMRAEANRAQEQSQYSSQQQKEEYDFLRNEYLKDNFPATTNQEFINLE